MTRMARGAAAAAVGFLLALALGACHHSSATLAVAPSAPTGVVATAGDTQVTLSWGPVKGATGYNLYWSPSPGVTPASGTEIAGVTSPYTQTGLTDGTTYYYVVTAVNAAGESGASIQVNATPQLPPPPPPPAWTWMTGSNAPATQGTYSSPGSPGTLGARIGAATWTDSAGHLWLFGGLGYDGSGAQGYLNDLWTFDGTSWIWVNGNSGVSSWGNFGGGPGATGAGIQPSARQSSGFGIDSSGRLWLFGGYGYDSTGGLGYLNDLWMFDPTTGYWTYVTGSNVANQYGSYGSPGSPIPNPPGSREYPVLTVGPSGNLWIFGGNGYGTSGSPLGALNDLWMYNVGLNQWTLMPGSTGIPNTNGSYALQGSPSGGNIPGSRFDAVGWSDASGSVWIYGGFGYPSTGSTADLSDLWRFDQPTQQWDWVGGGTAGGEPAVYGTEGTAAPANTPGARSSATAARDGVGNVWLFGGSITGVGSLNDLWRFDGTNWTWVAGSNTLNGAATYGTLGTPDPANVPGARNLASSWVTPDGHFWLFGGQGYASGGATGSLNDLWRYGPLP